MKPRVEFVVVGASEYQLLHYGSGESVLLYPSLGRPGTDFDSLASDLARSGFHAIAINPPGIATTLATWANLGAIAEELWAIVDTAQLGRVILVGHAFGNRVMRATSAARPGDVAALVLLACGGDVAPDPEVVADLTDCFDARIDPSAHERAVKAAFFAAANDVGEWRNGWFADLAQRQREAVANSNFNDFALGGTAPCLVVQGLDDLVAPPPNAWNLVARRPRTRVLALPDCGHAILPEQPRSVSEAVVSFLRETSA